MKRAIGYDFQRAGAACLGLTLVMIVSGCSAPARQPTQAAAGPSAWVTTPMVEGAMRTPQGLILRGTTAPTGRVVVRGATGVAYATSADDQGRFTLRIGAPATDTLFVVETQNGQDASSAPYRLLVTRDVDGPIALLAPGGPSRRLDRTGPLDAIDGDGRAMLASGRSEAGAVLPVVIGSRAAVSVRAGRDGRWVVPLDGGGGTIAVGGRSYVGPAMGGGAGDPELMVQASGAGRLVRWTAPGRTTQSSWFPNGS